MPTYEFRCLDSGDPLDAILPTRSAPSIGETIACRCEEATYSPHPMRRVIQSVAMAEVRGTGNGPIGRGLEDRAELGRRRRAEWK